MRRALAGLAIALCAAACDSPPAISVPDLFRAPSESTLSVRALGPEGPVARARVCTAAPSGAGERCAVTDARGEAGFRLRHGTYVVRGEPPEGVRMRALAVVHLEVAGTTDAVVVFERVAPLSGRISSAEGAPVANAEVCAHPATHEAPSCERSRADGTYVIEAKPGLYRIHVDGPPDGSRLVTQWARGRVASYEADVIDSRGGEAVGVDVVLVRGLVLSGTVTAAGRGGAGLHPDARRAAALGLRAHRQARPVCGAAPARDLLGLGDPARQRRAPAAAAARPRRSRGERDPARPRPGPAARRRAA